MTPDEFVAALGRMLDEFRFGDVPQLIDKMAPIGFSSKQVRQTLSLLRRKALFADLEHCATQFIEEGHDQPIVGRLRAQALLDQNRVEQALLNLERLKARAGDNEAAEVQGLIGRAYKQRYINEGHQEDLFRAIDAYRIIWDRRQGDYRWHGINVAALLARARNDGVAADGDERVRHIAQVIEDEIEQAENPSLWDYGTAMEAAIALGRDKEALRWAGKYVRHPDADAFELSSTLRQFKEVWRLERTAVGKQLLPVLEHAILQRKGGAIVPTFDRVEDRFGFESIYGQEGYNLVAWIDTMLARCQGIARLCEAGTYAPKGTGFLVAGSKLRPEWSDAPVLVTNAHVVSEREVDQAPLRPDAVVAEFTRLDKRPQVRLGPLLFSSPREELDVSILRIDAPAGVAPVEMTVHCPVRAQDGKEPQRIYVIGHPQGGELAASIYDNELVGYADPYVHYRSPTAGGSSGAPVFNRTWQAFALHHRARDDLKANEGVQLGRIRDRCQKSG